MSTLFSDISNFEVQKELWRPYLSLCLQNLSPLSTSLSIWASGSAKAETETFCEIHKGWATGLKKNIPIIGDKSLKFEPETRLRPFVKSAPAYKYGHCLMLFLWFSLTRGADFTKGLKSRFRLKFKTLVLNFVNRMLSPWS